MTIDELDAARDALAEEWKQRSPSTPAEIADFYVHAQNYKEDLDQWHAFDERKEWSVALVAAAKACKAHSILDIGAGAGHDIEALYADDPTYLLHAIEPNLKLQQHLVDSTHTTVVFDSFKDIDDTFKHVSGGAVYDMIYCIDVLEHVPDPDALLSEMLKHLKMGGIFIEATATHDTSTPLHLPELRGWSPSRFLDANGFVIETNVNRLRVWHRIQESRSNNPNLLLCAYRSVGAETSAILTKLVRNNWRFTIHMGDALVSRVRSMAVSEWYQDDAGDVFLMIDDDILFEPEDAEKIIALAREKRSIASAAYPVRGATHFASRIPFKELKFGTHSEGPVKITWAGTGFIAVHRDVIEALIKTTSLCIMSNEQWFWPMFQPFVWYNEEREYNEYLSEDWAFCERARQLGFDVWLDPSIILTHVGTKPYTVHDMLQVEEKDGN